jgi:predicted  nucleic acid-binding Zn-ribbon protein
MPTDNKIIHQCSKCSKIYKTKGTLQKHASKCNIDNSTTSSPTLTSQENNTEQDIPKVHENTYDINMKFVDGNKVKVEVHKQGEDGGNNEDEEEEEDGKEVLNDLLRPKVSPSYQEEINKLTNLIDIFKKMPISTDPDKKDSTIEQLKVTITVLMTQSQNLIKEMKLMSRKNSYYKNNIMLATFILDNCRKDPPETDEEFENIFE